MNTSPSVIAASLSACMVVALFALYFTFALPSIMGMAWMTGSIVTGIVVINRLVRD